VRACGFISACHLLLFWLRVSGHAPRRLSGCSALCRLPPADCFCSRRRGRCGGCFCPVPGRHLPAILTGLWSRKHVLHSSVNRKWEHSHKMGIKTDDSQRKEEREKHFWGARTSTTFLFCPLSPKGKKPTMFSSVLSILLVEAAVLAMARLWEGDSRTALPNTPAH
jgi:hypothetical protein